MIVIKHHGSIVVTLEFLKKVESCLKRKLDIADYSVDYECRFKKSAPQHFSTADALIDCDNSLNRRIVTLKICVEAKDDSKVGFDLTIGRQEQEEFNMIDWYTVYGSVYGEYRCTITIFDELKYQINRVSKPPLYTFLARSGVLFTLGSIAALTAVYVHCFGWPQEYANPLLDIKDPYDTLPFWYRTEQLSTACAIPAFVVWVLRHYIKKIFQRTVFLFGDGQDELMRKAELKNRIIWDIIIAILVGVAGSFAYEMFGVILRKLFG